MRNRAPAGGGLEKTARPLILLSTYNGSKYIDAQLESLVNQSVRGWDLAVRDDGSTDDTRERVEAWARKDDRIQLAPADGERLGPTRGFARLMEFHGENRPLFFCDQDDIWEQNKIERSMAALDAAEKLHGPSTPILVHTDLSLVDATGQPMAPSAKAVMGFRADDADPFARLVAQNFVTGCTVLINPALAEASLPISPEALMHDWWIALVAAAFGKIIYVDEPLIRYRQHGQNASGATRRKSLVEGVRAFWTSQDEFRKLMTRRWAQLAALETHLVNKGAPHPWLGAWLEKALHRPWQALDEGLRRGVRMQGWPRSVAFYLLLLRGFPRADSRRLS